MVVEIRMDFEDLADLSGWFGEWRDELLKVDNYSFVRDPSVIEAITDYVKQELAESLVNVGSGSNSFGMFMAKRTVVSVDANSKTLMINVSGLTEKQLHQIDPEAGARVSKDDSKDYNLWAFYESGRFDMASADKDSNRKAIVKDVGGVVAIREGGKLNQRMDGSREGLVGSIVARIRDNIKDRIAEAAKAHVRMIIAAAGEEAAKKARKRSSGRKASTSKKPKRTVKIHGLNKVSNQMRSEAAKHRRDFEQELSKMGASLSIERAGQGHTVKLRDAKGRYMKMPTGMKQIRILKG